VLRCERGEADQDGDIVREKAKEFGSIHPIRVSAHWRTRSGRGTGRMSGEANNSIRWRRAGHYRRHTRSDEIRAFKHAFGETSRSSRFTRQLHAFREAEEPGAFGLADDQG